MKTAICYYSRHHGNTLKVLEAMAEAAEIDLIDVTSRMARNARRQAGARRKAGWRLSRAVTPPCGCFWRPPYSMIIDLLRMGSKCCFLAEKPL